MSIVMWSPKRGGQLTRRFRNLRLAVQFIHEACRQDFSNHAYLVHAKHNQVKRLEQWRNGSLSYRAKK